MSVWTHPICDDCWHAQQGERVPHRLVEEYREVERCCSCGKQTKSGIYIRSDPAETPFHLEGDHA